MRVLLVDDHAIIREGLRAILDRTPDVNVVGEASHGREAIALVNALRPDVTVMDVSMADLGGVDATRQILIDHPAGKVVGLSVHADRRQVRAMFEAGAVAYLVKTGAAVYLVETLRAVMRGDTSSRFESADVFVRAGNPIASSRSSRDVSERERDVLKLLAEGRSSKEIADRLGIAVPTVETHRRKIMAKLRIRSVAGLTKYALREGITRL